MLRLVIERKKRGWSQSYLAQRAGIHRPDMNKIERGTVMVYPGWKRKLARVFQMPAAVLFQEVEGDNAA